MIKKIIIASVFLILFQFVLINTIYSKSELKNLVDLNYQVLTSVTNDSDGYTWIGTTKGLYRFDGRELIKYSNDTSRFSISQSVVTNIFTGNDGVLYICNSSGYSRFDKYTGRFYNIKGNLNSLSILTRLQNGAFIAFTGSKQLSIINNSLDTIQKSIFLENVSNDIAINFENKSFKINKELLCLWEEKTLLVIDSTLEIITERSFSEKINAVNKYDDRILVATENGIYTLSLTGQVVSSNPVVEAFCKDKSVHFITSDSNQNIIMGITNKGVYRYNRETEVIELVQEYQDDQGNSAEFRLKYIDKHDILWINRGTKRYIGSFIIMTTPTFPEFTNLTKRIYDSGFDVPFNIVISDKKNRLFIISDNKLYIYEPKTSCLTPIKLNNVDGRFIWMIIDQKNRLWLLTSDYLYVYEIRTNNLELIKRLNIGTNYYAGIYELKDGTIVINKSSQFLAIDKEIKEIVTYEKASPPGLMSVNPIISPDGNEIIFKGYDQPYICYSSSKGFYDTPVNKFDFDVINTMSDSKGNIWLSTENGVVVEKKNGEKVIFNVSSGLPDNMVYKTVEDNLGNIWIATVNGLAKYDYAENKIINYYTVENKLYDFSFRSILKTSSGDIFLFGRSCLLKINPELSPSFTTPPGPHISYVKVNNNDYYGFPKDLILKYYQRNLNISFSSLDFIRSEMIQYEFCLENYDVYWNTSDYNKASYSNLKPGKYTFLLRAKYEGRNHYTETISLPIRIKYSFWQHPAFITIIILLLISVIVYTIISFVRIKISRSKYRLKSENEELKSNLFTNLSHAFRTPVSLIVSPFRELVEFHKWNKHETKLITIIDKNLNHVLHLTNQLLEYDNELDVLENQDYKLQVEEKDIVPVIRNTAAVFRASSIKNGISMYIDTPETCILPFDEDKIVKIFFNIIGNAIKFTPKKGSIRISAKVKEDKLLLAVVDTGLGIKDDIKHNLFNNSFRIRNYIKNPQENTRSFGIGLIHTKQLVTCHKGEISVHDNKPKGTIFTFTIPLFLEAYKQEEIVDKEELTTLDIEEEENDFDIVEGLDKKLNLLIVEDNEELLEYLQTLLLKEYEVTIVKDGIEAIEAINNNIIDIIITDVMMPRMDGFELCKWIKENPEYCHLPLIMLTAKSSMSDKLEGIGCGADAYITKPFEPVYLKAIIQNILENRNKIRDIVQKGSKLPEGETLNENPLTINKMDAKFIENLNKLIDENLANFDLKINDLCREIGFSRTNFFKKVNALTGMTPNDYIFSYRLNKAIELLRTGEYSIEYIAETTGFSSPSFFSKKFKLKFGESPSRYLKKN